MAITFQKIIMKNGNKINLPKLSNAEIGFCNDSKQVFIGSDTGNIEIAKKELVDAVVESLLAKIELIPKGEKGDIGPVGPKGERGDTGITPEEITSILNKIQVLEGKVAALEGGGENPTPTDLPNFLGLIPFKPIGEITYDDLNIAAVKQGLVQKPQTVYTHSDGAKLGQSCIIAFPKTFGSMTGVVDGAGVNIDMAYSWQDVTITIPGKGEIVYVIGGADEKLAYGNGVSVKWNIS